MRSICIFGCLFALVGCAGGSTAIAPVAQRAGAATLALKLKFSQPPAVRASQSRRPEYLSSSVNKIMVALVGPNNTQTNAQTVTVSPGVAPCTAAQSGSYTCTISFPEPSGTNTYFVEAIDESTDISQQYVTATLSGNTAAVPVVLDALVKAITVSGAPANFAPFNRNAPSSCGSSSFTGIGDQSTSNCELVVPSGSVSFPLTIVDENNSAVSFGNPGLPVFSATTTNAPGFAVSVDPSTDSLQITSNYSCQQGGTYDIGTLTITETPPNSAGASPGDGLSVKTLTLNLGTTC